MIYESYVGEQLEALKSRVSILENQMADLLRQDETESVPDVCMTNEEAIRILKSKMDGTVDTSYEFGEAIRMAIRALKEQQTYSEMTKPIKEDAHEVKTDLCKTCKEGDICELSTKIFSGCRTTRCYKHEEAKNEN